MIAPHWYLIFVMYFPGPQGTVHDYWNTILPMADAKTCALERQVIEQTKAAGEETVSYCTQTDFWVSSYASLDHTCMEPLVYHYVKHEPVPWEWCAPK